MVEISIDPLVLRSTQFTGCPSNDYVRPYSYEKDPGIRVGVDERRHLWIIDGHNRVGAAIEIGTLVRVCEFVEVTEMEMFLLVDG